MGFDATRPRRDSRPPAVQASARRISLCSSSPSTAGLRPAGTAEGGCPCASAYRTNSGAARRIAPAGAYAHIFVQLLNLRSRHVSPEGGNIPIRFRANIYQIGQPESPPSIPRRAFPPARSGRRSKSSSRGSCPVRSIDSAISRIEPASSRASAQSRIPRAPAASLFRACRRSPAKTLRVAHFKSGLSLSFFVAGRTLRLLPSYLPPQPARPVSNTPGCSLSLISTDADRTYQTRHPLRGARPLAAHPHFSKSQSEPIKR